MINILRPVFVLISPLSFFSFLIILILLKIYIYFKRSFSGTSALEKERQRKQGLVFE